MRKLLALVLAAAVVAALASTAFAATKTVKIGDVFFKPKSTSVAKNTKVTWKWTGSLPHNVTVKKGPIKFHSPTKTSGTFSKKLTKKGTYVLYCTVHGYKAQHMTIKVN
jgi:plastocyanin